ncbi:hypothetical protein CPB83DRAFT_855896 [Crepidotus variabilis]|uniref:Uncharacterized protein n=1 Tax=Crepidotus variabilis TaxID=179855 RepID=A0A9P6JNL5_9AGAR|nr:hypothetical protein CPB83DRAFT_855896 [Crepidotus variabilis]
MPAKRRRADSVPYDEEQELTSSQESGEADTAMRTILEALRKQTTKRPQDDKKFLQKMRNSLIEELQSETTELLESKDRCEKLFTAATIEYAKIEDSIHKEWVNLENRSILSEKLHRDLEVLEVKASKTHSETRDGGLNKMLHACQAMASAVDKVDMNEAKREGKHEQGETGRR